MRVIFLLLLPLFFSVTPSLGNSGFSEKCERDYIIFNPLNQYRTDNPMNRSRCYAFGEAKLAELISNR